MTEPADDPYIDPATGVLRNLVGAKTKVALEEIEGDLSFARLVQLVDHPVAPTGDLDELRAIHRHLFQDVYAWAGELRTINMRKSVPGADLFLPVELLWAAAGNAFMQLREDNMLTGLSREQFVERLAHHYDQVNYLHPFREGNGRTQRLFWDRIAVNAGWVLDWSKTTGQVNDDACRIATRDSDLSPLKRMLDEIVRDLPADGRAAGVMPSLTLGTATSLRTKMPEPPADLPPGPGGGRGPTRGGR